MAWTFRAAVAVLAATAASAFAAPQAADNGATTVTVPEATREFRASWVATVANIDWPSKKGLSTEEQQAELIAILDRTRDLNMNAIVLQIRPAADALYQSELEPWSEYLSGEQGKAPEPFYDPLKFAVDEGRKRGVDIHVWFNPYRARLLRADKDTTGGFAPPPTDPNHISVTHPEVVKTYGNFHWMDPGEKLVQDQSMAVILDVVKRYDIDGVHMDDYFYPYPINDPETKEEMDFPDDLSWNKYQQSGGELSRHDWRRQNVDKFIERLYKEVKAVKPKVLVGLSPFGIWKPGFPENVRGLNQYEKLYADAKLWLNEGWVDYWTPQLYWRVQDLSQSYPELLKWWMEENTKNRHMWPGLYLTKTTFGPDEIINQIVLTRFLGATGHVLFSMKGFMGAGRPGNLNDRLTTTTGVYASPALIPATDWLGGEAPAQPTDLAVSAVAAAPTGATEASAAEARPARQGRRGARGADARGAARTVAEAAETTPAQQGTATGAVTTSTAELASGEAQAQPAQDRATARRGRRSQRGAAARDAATAPAPAPAKSQVEVSWRPASDPASVRTYAVQVGTAAGGTVSWRLYVVPGTETRLLIDADSKGNFPTHYAVSAVGDLGLTSAKAITTYAPAAATQTEAAKETFGQVQ